MLIDDCRYAEERHKSRDGTIHYSTSIVKTIYRGKGKKILVNNRFPSKMEALIEMYERLNKQKKGEEVEIEWQ